MPLRYIVAALVACLLIGAGIVFVRQTNARFQGILEESRQDLIAKRDAGKLPPEWQGVDLDELGIDQIKMPVPYDYLIRLDISRYLTKYAYVLAVFVFAVCLGVAALVGRMRKPRSTPSRP
jgi:hypothetical protein